MPVEEAVAEGERVIALVKQDNEIFRTTGIDLQYFDSLVKRVNAYSIFDISCPSPKSCNSV